MSLVVDVFKLMVLFSLFSSIYRCITCGSDTKQEINGLIRFMPIAQSGIGKQPVMKMMDEDVTES